MPQTPVSVRLMVVVCKHLKAAYGDRTCQTNIFNRFLDHLGQAETIWRDELNRPAERPLSRRAGR
jgi:hypothetical protein